MTHSSEEASWQPHQALTNTQVHYDYRKLELQGNNFALISILTIWCVSNKYLTNLSIDISTNALSYYPQDFYDIMHVYVKTWGKVGESMDDDMGVWIWLLNAELVKLSTPWLSDPRFIDILMMAVFLLYELKSAWDHVITSFWTWGPNLWASSQLIHTLVRSRVNKWNVWMGKWAKQELMQWTILTIWRTIIFGALKRRRKIQRTPSQIECKPQPTQKIKNKIK